MVTVVEEVIVLLDKFSGSSTGALGMALEKQGRIAEARAAYRAELDNDPGSPPARQALGRIAGQ